MTDALYNDVAKCAKNLHLDFNGEELAKLAVDNQFDASSLKAIDKTFQYLSHKKDENVVNTLLRLSRIPLKSPKTFENYDFGRIHGQDVDALKSLSSLAEVYSGTNIAFIGPPGVGKTHLAQAYGRLCCKHGLKTYYLKASELRDKFTDARKYGRESRVLNGLVKPTCLIIDEIGKCIFDKENTSLFFDMVDRRYSKEAPNIMILTSNNQPGTWDEYFTGKADLLCSLDRLFDKAKVFIIKGESYRGRECQTLSVEAGNIVG